MGQPVSQIVSARSHTRDRLQSVSEGIFFNPKVRPNCPIKSLPAQPTYLCLFRPDLWQRKVAAKQNHPSTFIPDESRSRLSGAATG
jgi:hypothetical protein